MENQVLNFWPSFYSGRILGERFSSFCRQFYYLAGMGFYHVFGLFVSVGLLVLHHVCGPLVSVGLLALYHVFGLLVGVRLSALHHVFGPLVSVRSSFSVISLLACASNSSRSELSVVDLSTCTSFGV